jgi:hypothetical protein
MPREHPHLAIRLLHFVVDAQQILTGAIKLAETVAAAFLVFADARRFLEKYAALLGFVAENGVDNLILYGRIGAVADSGIQKKIMNIAQPARHAVNEVFAFTASKNAPRDRDFGVFGGQDMF